MLPLIQRVLAIVGELLGIAKSILGITETTAQEHAKYAIETIVSNGTNTVIHPTYGNSALRALLLDILSAIDVPNSTVVLPPTPPTGYGGATSSEVWNTIIQILRNDGAWGSNDTASNNQVEQTGHGVLFSQWGYRDSRAPSFALAGNSPGIINQYGRNGGGYTPMTPPVEPDWSSWNGTDSLQTFLLIDNPTYYWDYYDPNSGNSTPGICWSWGNNSHGNHWRCVVEEWMLPLVSGRLTGALSAIRTPPVWPGIASVTLGTPVAIANGASSAQACDGVIVAITAVPPGQGSYTFDTHESYVHLGQLAFVDDNGEYEDAQSFTFDASILTPRRMAHAAGFVMRCRASVTGTVTPWTAD